MTQKTKRLTFLIAIPKGEESKFLAYKKMCRELDKSINGHIWGLINQDAERLFVLMEILEKEKIGDKEKNGD